MGIEPTILKSLGQSLLQVLFLSQLLAPFPLQPALRSVIGNLLFVILQVTQVLSNTGDSTFRFILRCAVGRREIAQGWTGLEERQEGRGEFIGHFELNSSECQFNIREG